MIKNKKLLFVISIILFSSNIFSQNWHWESKITNITDEGYYKINISPEIVSASVNNTGDIRIFDEKDNEIPYILEKEQAVNLKEFFVEYKIIINQSLRKWPYYSRIVIHNPKKNDISNFQLIIRNADVAKSLKLSGSDDASHWYVIKDKYRFRSIYNDAATSVIKILNFPKSNYEYYEILIDDWRNNPLQIQKIGYFDTTVEEGKYAEITQLNIQQKELKKEKQSLIDVNFSKVQLINKIQLEIEDPEFYYRNAEILLKDSSVNKKKGVNYFYRSIQSFIISSNSLNTVYFNGLKTDKFFIRIENNDNQEINIKAVNCWQLKYYLVANLNKDTKYLIKTGNTNITKPEYDIEYFKSSIPKKLKVISPEKIINIAETPKKIEQEFQISTVTVWLIIGVIAIFLLYITTKMMKDIKK